MSDYISRDAAKQILSRLLVKNADCACNLVDCVLPADVEPVRHGMWKRYSTTMMECSLCGKHTARHKFNYCPNCGAKMDLEADHEN